MARTIGQRFATLSKMPPAVFILFSLATSVFATTCPGFPGYCSEHFPGQTCVVVCSKGRPNVPLCQEDGTWTDIPRCIEHDPGKVEQIPGLCPGISGYCSEGYLNQNCTFNCPIGPNINSVCTVDGTWEPYPVCKGDQRETHDGCNPCPGPDGRPRNRVAESHVQASRPLQSGLERKVRPSFAGNQAFGPLSQQQQQQRRQQQISPLFSQSQQPQQPAAHFSPQQTRPRQQQPQQPAFDPRQQQQQQQQQQQSFFSQQTLQQQSSPRRQQQIPRPQQSSFFNPQEPRRSQQQQTLRRQQQPVRQQPSPSFSRPQQQQQQPAPRRSQPRPVPPQPVRDTFTNPNQARRPQPQPRPQPQQPQQPAASQRTVFNPQTGLREPVSPAQAPQARNNNPAPVPTLFREDPEVPASSRGATRTVFNPQTGVREEVPVDEPPRPRRIEEPARPLSEGRFVVGAGGNIQNKARTPARPRVTQDDSSFGPFEVFELGQSKPRVNPSTAGLPVFEAIPGSNTGAAPLPLNDDEFGPFEVVNLGK